MGNFARSLGLARVTHVVGGYGFGSPHSLAGAIPVISSDPYRFSHLGKHTMKVYDGPNGLDPKKNHNCQLCHEGGTDRVQKNRRRKAADVFCIYCQRSLCLQCWPKWHEE